MRILISLVLIASSAIAHGSEKQILFTSKHDGPNCWNYALVTAKILPALRMTYADEFSYYMTSPLCRQLPESEAPIQGDIGAIRDREGNELHAFIHGDQNMVFTKNGWLKSIAYVSEPVEDTLRLYNGVLTNFRCLPLSTEGQEREVIEFHQSLSRFENEISKEAISDEALNSELLAELSERAQVLIRLVQAIRENPSAGDPKVRFFVGAFWIRLAASARQLDYDSGNLGFFAKRRNRQAAEELRRLANLLKTENRGLK